MKNNSDFSKLPWFKQFAPLIFNPQYIFYFLKGKIQYINPCIDGISGLIGTDKFEILKNIPEKFRGKLFCINTKIGLKKILLKIHENNLQFPFYVKPKVGERSCGVEKLKNEKDLENYLKKYQNQDTIFQENLKGTEFGVSIYRDLETKKFKIFYIAQKISPQIIGDGKTTIGEYLTQNFDTEILEKLKLKNKHQLNSIPQKNEEIELTDTNTIANGVIFKNKTSEFREKFETSLNKFFDQNNNDFWKYFNAGRFDLKIESIKDMENNNFKIIELNGIGGVPLCYFEENPISFFKKWFDILKEIALNNYKNKNELPPKILSTYSQIKLIISGIKDQKNFVEKSK